MNRAVFEIRRTNWSVLPKAIAALVVIGFAVYGVSAMFESDVPAEPAGAAGVDPNATRLHLRELSTILVTADKKPDAQLASKVKLQAIAAMVTIDQQPGAKDVATPMQACAVAARHLADAAGVVENGGRWTNEDTFQSAAANCRS